MYPLFRSMSVMNVLTLFEMALVERKIILVSSYYSMLTMATETISTLLYPLCWHYNKVPVLPAHMLHFLEAPVPYIMGVNREYFTKETEDEFRPPDVRRYPFGPN
jgi:hypothetical protein